MASGFGFGFIPPPTGPELRSRDVSGCMLWKEYGQLERGGLNSIVSHFQSSCKTSEFSAMWIAGGFDNATFHPNEELKKGRPSYEKFLQGLKDLDRNVTFGVVFHGSAPGNMQSIKINGLDPSLRKGQVFGPGEYFSKEPGVSVD